MRETIANREQRPVRILLLEDSDIDTELLISHLHKADLCFKITRAMSRKEFIGALAGDDPDVILADYALPDFDGLSALTIARELYPNLPFIFVSGVVGEEFATNALKRGATDYVMKRNLGRVATAIDRALAEARERAERQRAERALRASELSTRLAVDAAGLGMWDYDPRSGRLAWDLRCKAMFGLPADAAVDLEVFLSGCHPDDRERMRAVVAAVVQADRPQVFEDAYRTVAPDGTERWVSSRGQTVFEDGVCARFIGVLRDISDEKREEQALRGVNETLGRRVEERTEERDRIWQLSQDLLAVVGFDGRLRSVNPAWTRLLGHDEAALLGRSYRELLHDSDGWHRAVRQLRAGVPVQRFDDRLRCTNGLYRWISWTAVPAGELFYAIGRDVTDQRAAAQALEARNRELAQQIAERERVEDTLRQMQRLEAVGQLTSGVAHDFNNLLTVILGNITFVERDLEAADLDGRLRQRLATMRTAADRGATLTSQLLAFSRRQRLEPKPVDLNETVASMRSLLQSTMGGSVRIETVLKPDLWPALVDPTQIELIILNLAINARDAMEVGGSLTVETRNVQLREPFDQAESPSPGEYVMMSVSDTGVGMSEEVLAKAFEPFFTTKDVGKGSGLGLAQVYGFARQSGGGVRIRTQVGEGTSVEVYLPRAAAQDSPARRSASDVVEMHAPLLTRRILLVDDDSAVRDVTASMLADVGYRVVTAGSGAAALDLLERSDDFDLLLVDYAMPGMSGAETAAEARRRRPELPVLFITGFADLAALKDVGDERIVQKPFRDGELATKVRCALGGHQNGPRRAAVITLDRHRG